MTAEKYTKAFIQSLGEETFQVLHDRTPIDTGKARKGYVLNVNTDGFDVTNNEDHIVALDEGHSQQAPQGMNQLTLQEMPSIVERVLAKLPKQYEQHDHRFPEGTPSRSIHTATQAPHLG